MTFADASQIAKLTVNDWLDDDASRLAAALAFYGLLSLAPLVVIAVAISGLWFGAEAARGQIAAQLSHFVGRGAAEGIQAVVVAARSQSSGVLGTIVGVLTVFVGASGVFLELQYALNTIWDVRAKPGRGWLGEMKDRFVAFILVLIGAFLLLASLLLSAVTSAVGHFFSSTLQGGEPVWQLATFAFSLLLTAALVAMLFKYVPDVEIEWQDVWFGAGATALLLTVGKSLLGVYLGKASLASSYGAAGSLVALIVWVYYSAQILFVGAELTQTLARFRGRPIKPAAKAEALTKPGRALRCAPGPASVVSAASSPRPTS